MLGSPFLLLVSLSHRYLKNPAKLGTACFNTHSKGALGKTHRFGDCFKDNSFKPVISILTKK